MRIRHDYNIEKLPEEKERKQKIIHQKMTLVPFAFL